MAEKYEIELEVNVEIEQVNIANTSITNLTKTTEKNAEASENAAKKSRTFGEAVLHHGNAVLENSAAMKILNDVTDGYADKVSDAVEISKLFIGAETKAAIEKKISAAGTYALTAAQSAYTLVVGASTGAMKAFRIALAGTGIGLIIIAIVALIANFDKIKQVVLNMFPPLRILGDIFGGLINWVTDFVGATSEAGREVDALADKAAKNAKARELQLEAESDLYDKHTLKKLKAEEDLNKKIKEIRDTSSDELTDEQKLTAIKDATKRFHRDLINIDKEAAQERIDVENARLQTIKDKLNSFSRREEDTAAKTNLQKINLAQKRELDEINLMQASEAQKQVLRDKSISYYAGQRAEEWKKISAESKKKKKETEANETERLKSVNKILEDYRKKEEDAKEKSYLEKIKIDEEQAIKELEQIKASAEEKGKIKEKIEEYYSNRRKEQQEKEAAQTTQLEKEKQNALRSLEADQKEWEMEKKQQEIDAETDPKKKFENQIQLYEEQRIVMQEQADFEMQNLRAIADNTKLSAKERADAEAQYAAVKQNLGQSLADHDKKMADTKKQYDESVKQNSINTATSTAKTLIEMGGKGAELAKGMAAAQAIQDTYKGATSAYSSLSGIPVVGPALGAAAAGVAVASGLMNVKKILATKPVEKSAPGAGGQGGAAVPEAPAFNLVQGTGSNQIAEAVANSGNTPIQAYVVSSNVTTSQNLERNIVDQSRI